MTVKLRNVSLRPGERREGFFPLGHRPDGSPLGLPLIALAGAREGPRLGIVTGIHGDEYEGPEALRRVMAEIDPAALSGAIICTPEANVTAYEAFDRTSWIDHLDLNRSFPGRAEGFLTQRTAAAIVSEIIEQCDAMLDLHSAGLTLDLEPYVAFNNTPGPAGEASFAMAKTFGIPLLYSSTPFPNVIRLEAAKRNIPAILVEVGGEARLRPARVDLMKRGIENVLRHLGMLEGTPEGLPESYILLKAPPLGEFSHVSTGGFIRAFAGLGQRVRAGELLGTIVDVFGHELARIESPIDGMVLSYRTIPAVRTGDWGYSVVHVIGEASWDTPLSAVPGGPA